MKIFKTIMLLIGVSTTVSLPIDRPGQQKQDDQTVEIRLGTLELGRRDKEVFSSRDSMLVLHIDTLIMKDRSSLHFYGKKKVTMHIGHAEIGNRAYFSGISDANNASDFDITIQFEKLGSLYVMANGLDATNGTRTDPNGDGGNVILRYRDNGVLPQQEDRRKPNYLHIDVSAGGRHINPTADIGQIYSQIINSRFGLRGLPQGQIYSGSMGREGSAEVLVISPDEDW